MIYSRNNPFAFIGMLLLLLSRSAMGADIPLKVNGSDYKPPVQISVTLANSVTTEPIKITLLTLQAAVPVKGLKLTSSPLTYNSPDGKPDPSVKIETSELVLDNKDALDLEAGKGVPINARLNGIKTEGIYSTKIDLASGDGSIVTPGEIELTIKVTKPPSLPPSSPALPPQPASAVTSLSVISPEIDVFATQGDKPSTVNLTLHGGGAKISDITVAFVDLRSIDKFHTYSKSNMALSSTEPLEIDANKDISAPVTFTIGDTACGQYTGNMFVRYGRDSSLIVPVNISVRVGWFWPFVAVLAGSILSFAIGWYRANKLTGDQLLTDVAALRSHLNEEPAFTQGNPPVGAAFLQNIMQQLVAAGTNIDDAKFADAQKAVDAARALWLKWLQNRGDWITQFTTLAQTRATLAAMPGLSLSHYLQTLDAGLVTAGEQAFQNMPANLRDVLATLRAQLDWYRDLQFTLGRLDNAVNLLPEASEADRKRKQALVNTAQDLRQSLDNSEPSAMTQATHDAREKDMQAGLEDANGTPVLSPTFAAMALQNSEPAVEIPTLGLQILSQAKQRLILFNWFLYLFAVGITSIGGFVALYVANPVFGSSPVRDGLLMFLWGFGADQITRAGITTAITNVGLPGSK